MNPRLLRAPRRSRLLVPTALLVMAGLVAGCADDSAPDSAPDSGQAGSSESAPAVQAADAVTVDDPWVAATTGTADSSATQLYLVLDNDGDAPVTLTGGTSPLAGAVVIHEEVTRGGRKATEKVDGLTIQPGRGQLLQPGGYHLMLAELTDKLADGDTVPVELTFADGSSLALDVAVRTVEADDDAEGHDHKEHDHSEHDHGEHEHSEHEH